MREGGIAQIAQMTDALRDALDPRAKLRVEEAGQ